jgi:hypothetical protein
VRLTLPALFGAVMLSVPRNVRRTLVTDASQPVAAAPHAPSHLGAVWTTAKFMRTSPLGSRWTVVVADGESKRTVLVAIA